MKISKYWKGVVASLGPVLLLVQAAATDGKITGDEALAITIAALVAVGVISVPNRRPLGDDEVPGFTRQENIP